MSGVIDENGVQWEHCCLCQGQHHDGTYSERGRWVRIEDLHYQDPSKLAPFGKSMCADCAKHPDRCTFMGCKREAVALGQFHDEPEWAWAYQLCAVHHDHPVFRDYVPHIIT